MANNCYTGYMSNIAFNCNEKHDSMLESVYIARKESVNVAFIPGDETAEVTPVGETLEVYEVQVIKGSVNALTDILVKEKMPNMSTHTVNLTVWGQSDMALSSVRALKNGRWVVFTKGKNGATLVYGGMSGLECTAAPSDSSIDGGATSVTLATPESSEGDKVGILSELEWQAIANAAGATKLTTVIDGVDFGS